ncbi:MAG: haloacid dehalogenase [Gammaproteobacteria bacterium]|nr:MAG: haloacid dehalogenase [Gammaproteobacteria bacterium]
MDLLVFDLDGTLLDAESKLSTFTRDTLAMLAKRGIAYTVATGRTLYEARDLLAGAGFGRPQIYKNGVVIFNPERDSYSHRYLLTHQEIEHVIAAIFKQNVRPFVFTLDEQDRHAVYHAPNMSTREQQLATMIEKKRGVPVLPLAQLPADCDITNISAISSPQQILAITELVADEPHLVAYCGPAMEGSGLYWLDVHHSDGSKGAAVNTLRQELGASRVICFGDGDNDLSMFASADESYAPQNAKPALKTSATAVIEHHDADGVARFIRERFDL